MVKLTDTEAAIFEIQSALRLLSRENGKMYPPVVPDGIYGEKTHVAVVAFQKSMNIDQTGIVNYETWQLLFGHEY